MDNKITKAHGSGGIFSHNLIKEVFLKYFDNPILNQLRDAALLNQINGKLCFATDSHVIRPLFFPGGDIGKLAVAGTVNDLAVCGAKPLYLSCGFIIEEGFPISDLEKIVASMQKTAQDAGVNIVTGDTKVVEKGNADGIYINTAGVGKIPDNISLAENTITPGDRIIISGTIGDHEAAIICAREEFKITGNISSDCNIVNSLTEKLVKNVPGLRIMRDPTRGGLATILNEFADKQNFGLRIYEDKIPIKNSVRGLCEPMGFDPLYMANEGKIVIIVSNNDADKALAIMKDHKIGKDAKIIGEVIEEPKSRVLLKTQIGSDRILDMLTGEMLPRIC